MTKPKGQASRTTSVGVSGGDWNNPRTWIALVVVGLSILSTLILGGLMIGFAEGDKKGEAAQQVMIAILPLLGTWVGTVLAFYFSKDNFEAATRSTKELLGIEQMLAKITAKEAMIDIGDAKYFIEGDDGKIVISSYLEQNKKDKKGQRILIVSPDLKPRYIIHRSIFNDYLASEALSGKSKEELEKLTLTNLISSNPDVKAVITNFGIVKPDNTLDKVKAVMESADSRQDVFVTDTGKRDGKVEGWITNGILDEYSVV